MTLRIERHPANPIVRPGGLAWRLAVTFNPAVLRDDDGRFYLYERTAGSLRPFHCHIGLQVSDDGVRFSQVGDQPVFTPAMAGSEHGSVQDPRIVKIDGRYLMTYAFRPFAWASHPTGVGVPESHQVDYPGFSGRPEENQTRSGVAVSDDRVHWRHEAWVSGMDIDDRNVILFPEKLTDPATGEPAYAVLRRPQAFVATDTSHGAPPNICLSYSADLERWSEPRPIIAPAFAWESNRIGGSTPPVRTEAGWLVLYHGVETVDPAIKRVCYRMGAAMLDGEDPTKLIARCPEPLLEPTEYYEKCGCYIPNVVFPTAAVPVGEELYIYYGCCDTAIGLATVKLGALVEHVMRHPV
jgi:predicted GH43/DUF377 family glycosyl hydrolase